MAGWQRPRPVAAAALLVLAGVLAVSGFSAGGSPDSGAARSRLAGGTGGSAAAGGWGKAVVLRGAVTAPTGMSCSSPGTCGATGRLGGLAYVVSQVRGVWGRPAVIPGTARTRRPSSSPGGIACFSARSCLVAGSYTDTFGHSQAFIAAEVRGAWRKLIWVPGLARLDKGHGAGISQLACRSAGNCAASGSYTNAGGQGQPFIVFQVRGLWGRARPLPTVTGLPGQRRGTTGRWGPISCPSAGNCAAAGTYPVGVAGTQSEGNQVFVGNEVNGTWGTPMPVPGLARLNGGLLDVVSVISCPSPGTCVAAGRYNPNGNSEPELFVADETAGTWGTAAEIQGVTKLNTDSYDEVLTISCPAAGACVMGGAYNIGVAGYLSSQAFVVSQVHGTWRKAFEVPGVARLDKGTYSSLMTLSCSSAGNCGGGGNYDAVSNPEVERTFYVRPFVVNEVHGIWDKALEVPGVGNNLHGEGEYGATAVISCPAPDRCSAGGWYTDAKGNDRIFVDSQP